MFGQRFATSEISSNTVTFQFAVNTAATGAGEKKAAFPLNLYGQNGTSVTINWGDGSIETLTPADYAAADSTASVHEYASAGEYTVTVTSGSWESIYLLSCYVDGAITSTNNANLPVYVWRRTLTAVESPLPPVKGVKKLATVDATAMTESDDDLGYLFHRCEKMTSIPANTFVLCSHITVLTAIFYHCSLMAAIPAGLLDPLVNAVDLSQFFRYWIALKSVPAGLFDKCTNVVNLQETFRYCQTLETIPEGLFRYNTLATNMLGMFRVCSMLKDFKLCIGSPSVSTVSDFIVNASNVTRIVCVPANSTTYTTFNSYKNSSNNLIVSTDLDDCIQIDSVEESDEWQFSVNTEATVAGEKTTGVPFNLNGQSGIELTVDWGDGTTSTLTSSDYTASDITASLHTYETAGTYSISVVSNDWENTYLHATSYYSTDSTSSGSDADCAIYAFRKTLTSVITPYPKLKGTRYITSSSASTLTVQNDSFNNCFQNCRKLTSIPAGLFDSNPLASNFAGSFGQCASLQSIPSNLFNLHSTVTTFSSCFSGCTSLQSIPSGIFDGKANAANFYRCFYKCTSLQSIPAGLFDDNAAADSFEGCFAECTSISSIPSGLFDSNTLATNFASCFYNCSISSIPSGLFDNNTLADKFNNCFSGCSSLASIPSGLFDNAAGVTTFSGCFSRCTNLASIPSGLFSNHINVLTFKSCFSGCSSIASLPSGIFMSNAAATDFSMCFYECTSLQSIESNLFSGCTAATTFSYCFYGCASLASIPANLFSSNTQANDFSNCFYGCNSIVSIPEGLFSSNRGATKFYYCFSHCNLLSSIPTNLFYYNTAITKIYQCFSECPSINDFTLAIKSSVVDSASSFATYKANAVRTINVPANSTTYTTFSNVASSLGLTIVGV